MNKGYWEGFTRSQFIGLDDMGEPKYRDGRIYYCSECRRRSIIKTNFCPDCGADMRERKDNGEDNGKID